MKKFKYFFLIIITNFVIYLHAAEEKKALIYFHGGGGIFGKIDQEKDTQFIKQLESKYNPIIQVDYNLFWTRNHSIINQHKINEIISTLPKDQEFDVLGVSAGAYIFMNSIQNLERLPKKFIGISPMLTSEGTFITQTIEALNKLTDPPSKNCNNANQAIQNIDFPLIIFHGENDPIIKKESLEQFCKDKNCKFNSIKNGKHRLLNHTEIIEIIKNY